MSEVLADLMLWFLLLSKLQSKLSILKFNNSVLSLSTENGNSKLFETSKRCYQKLTFKPANGIKFEKFQFPSTPRKSFNKQYKNYISKIQVVRKSQKSFGPDPKTKIRLQKAKKIHQFPTSISILFFQISFQIKETSRPSFYIYTTHPLRRRELMTSNKLLFAHRSVQATLIKPRISKKINLNLKFSVLKLTISSIWQNSSLINLVSHGFSAQSGYKAQASMYLLFNPSLSLQFKKNF